MLSKSIVVAAKIAAAHHARGEFPRLLLSALPRRMMIARVMGHFDPNRNSDCFDLDADQGTRWHCKNSFEFNSSRWRMESAREPCSVPRWAITEGERRGWDQSAPASRSLCAVQFAVQFSLHASCPSSARPPLPRRNSVRARLDAYSPRIASNAMGRARRRPGSRS